MNLAVRGDAQFDVRRGRADRVRAHGAVGLRRDVEKGLGLSVKLLEIEAERAIERKQIRADRLAGGVGDADAGESERIFQRTVDQRLAERVVRAGGPWQRLAIDDLLAPAARDGHEMAKQPALERAGVLHPDHHPRQQRLEHPRRGEMEGRPDLAKVLGRGVGAFRAGHAEPGDEALRVIEVMVARPGQRQKGEHFVAIGQVVERDGVARRRDAALAAQHDALGAAGRARGVQDHRGIAALAFVDPPIERRGGARLSERRAPVGYHPIER
jgi:hypothetical protein